MARNFDTHDPAHRIIANDGKPAFMGESREVTQSFGDGLREIIGDARYSIEPVASFNPDTEAWEALDDQRAVIYRNPSEGDGGVRRTFGIVSPDFRILQPEALIEALDPVVRDYPVATMGILGTGSQVFVALRGPDMTVNGEAHQSYITCLLSFEPGTTTKMYSGFIREWCWNTQVMAQAAAQLRFDVSHSGDVNAKTALAGELVASFAESQDAFKATMEMYAKHAVTGEEIDAVLAAAYPIPKRPKSLSQTVDKLKPEEIAAMADGDGAFAKLFEDLNKTERAYANAVARAQDAQAVARACMGKFDVEFPQFAGTAYSLYNACTQTSDWRNDRDGNVRGGIAERVAPGGSRWYEKVRAATALAGIVS